jgi:N,N'-diacetyllegionaminate synthase
MSVTLIAEIGVNHDGDLEKAKRMVLAAKDAGVTIVKFQHYDPFKLLGPLSPYLTYATQCQFSKEQHEELKRFCDSVGAEYLVSVFDIADVRWADSLCKRHKVASRMNRDQEFISALLKTDKPVIISTQSYDPLPLYGVDYMFCITEYPTNLDRMANLPCNNRLGLSSHCPSIAPSLKAVAQGAKIIEHHVTFDRNEPGCDKSSSITFDELKQLNRWANEMAVI